MCQRCFSEDKTLHVHHKQYIDGRKVWEYEAPELLVLCDECHEQEHELLKGLKLALARSFRRTEELTSVIEGFSHPPPWGAWETRAANPAELDSLSDAASILDALACLPNEQLHEIYQLASRMFDGNQKD